MSQDYDRGRLEPHRGGLIMILGILSLIFAPFILGPIAWIMGKGDLKKIKEGTMDPEGQGQTQAGYICGMIATIVSVVSLLIGCCVLIAVFGFGLAAFNMAPKKQDQFRQNNQKFDEELKDFNNDAPRFKEFKN